jgi:hypothetical protein
VAVDNQSLAIIYLVSRSTVEEVSDSVCIVYYGALLCMPPFTNNTASQTHYYYIPARNDAIASNII